jgi:hypothetical protein
MGKLTIHSIKARMQYLQYRWRQQLVGFHFVPTHPTFYLYSFCLDLI